MESRASSEEIPSRNPLADPTNCCADAGTGAVAEAAFSSGAKEVCKKKRNRSYKQKNKALTLAHAQTIHNTSPRHKHTNTQHEQHNTRHDKNNTTDNHTEPRVNSLAQLLRPSSRAAPRS